MRSQQAVTKPKRPCVLRSVVVGTRRLILYQSFRDVLDIEPAPDDPLTVTVKDAIKLSGLSRATISRLLKAGSTEQSQAA
jgi:hypothetical protein